MKPDLTGLSRRYQAALKFHLQHGLRRGLRPAHGLGRRAMSIGLETLDMARMHEQALIKLVLPGDSLAARDAMARRAGMFFAEAITPMEKTHRIALEAAVRLRKANQTLRQRCGDLSASARDLRRQIAQRKSAEKALKQSERHYVQLLEQSRQMQEQLRLLSRQLLSAQEEERKKISRELHDVIAQTLTGINLRLAALKHEANAGNQTLEQNIARTQELVRHSVDIVHRFARELRPTVLDDLGLVPALRTFMETFKQENGIRVSLAAFAGVEQVDDDKRTVLYRVAQEALTNVARHAKASEAHVRIQKLEHCICMKISDNGKGFHTEAMARAKKNQRLGLLGMQERLQMVGGHLTVESTPGQGTCVRAQIPLVNGSRRETKHASASAGNGKH